MQSFSEPLNQLLEDGSWFARAHEIKLFVVRTSGDIRKTALKLLSGLEFHADNFSPWVLLEDPSTNENDGWQYRSNRLVKNWERRREAFAKEGTTLPEVEVIVGQDVPPITDLSLSNFHSTMVRSPSLAVFYHTSKEVIGALPSLLKGLVFIMAPSMVNDPEKLEEELEVLLSSQDLDTCRIALVLDNNIQPPQRLLDLLGDRGLLCECIVNPKKYEEDLRGMLASENDEGESAVSAGAWPRGVAPPKRIDAPPEAPKEERDAALLKAGINPEFLDQAPLFRKLIIGAALALKEGNESEAIRMQAKATTLCSHLEMHELQIICQITLANYLSGIGQTDIAIQELEDAVSCAAQHKLPNVQSQAYLALGLLHALDEQHTESVMDYARAARAAELAKIEALAIEAWRMAGQMALQIGDEEKAIYSFKEAIRLAGDVDEQTLQSSSAPEAARQFATFCKARGLDVQANSLFEQADQMEQGMGKFRPVDLHIPTGP